MDIQTENILVVRMTRLEAARTLVTPCELQDALRAQLANESPDPQTILDGKIITPALTAGHNGHDDIATPTTAKKMRAYRKATKRVACPHCSKSFKAQGLNTHIARAHKGEAHA